MIKFATFLFMLTFCLIRSNDQVLIEKIKLLGADEAKIRIKAKEDILKECYKFTYLLKQNLNNSELEIQESSREILSKFYNYQLEGMEGKLLPLGIKEKSAEEYNKFYKNWLLKKFNESYQKVGHKSPQWDKLVESLFDNVLDIYIGKNKNKKEIMLNAKSILDLGCQDPFITYIYANLNYILGVSNIAKEYFLLSEKRNETYKYDSMFRFFVFNKLLMQSVSEPDKINYAKKALMEMSQFFSQTKNEDDYKVLCKIAYDFKESIYHSDIFYKIINEEKFLNAAEMYIFFYNYFISNCTSKKGDALTSILDVSSNLISKYPNIVELPAILSSCYFENEDYEEGRNWFYKTLEIRPDYEKVFKEMQDSLTSNEVEGNDILLFGVECINSNISLDINNKFIISIWQNVCNKSYYKGTRWDQQFKDPYTYGIIKYGLDKTLADNPSKSVYLKSQKGLYAWLADDIKTAISEIPNYKNTPYLEKFQCYISPEEVLADLYPLLTIKNNDLIEFRSQYQTDMFSIKRMNLLLNVWNQQTAEKERFYLSRLFPYINFTNDEAINLQLFNKMFEYGRKELIIKKFQDYKKINKNIPPKVEELIKVNFGEVFNIFFEVTKNSKYNSAEEIDQLCSKLKQIAEDLIKANKSKELDYKTESSKAYLREVHEFLLEHFNNKFEQKVVYTSGNHTEFFEFYETRRPQLHLNAKDIPNFNYYSECLFFPYYSRVGSNAQKEFNELATKTFKDEAEVISYVKMIFVKGYSLPFRFQLGLILKKQGFNEIAEYILMDTYCYYQHKFCFQKDINYDDLDPLYPLKGLENYICDLIELSTKSPKGYHINDELKMFFCLVNNKRYDLALLRSSQFTLDRQYPNFSNLYYYDSVEYKTIDFINLLRKKINEEKDISENTRIKLLKTLDKFEEVQVKK